MSEIFNWMLHIPEYLGQLTGWLVEPIEGLGWSPLAIIGSSAGVAIGAILIMHVVHLVNPWG